MLGCTGPWRVLASLLWRFHRNLQYGSHGCVWPQDNKHRSDLWYNHSVDTWAVGVLAYELLNGCPPFAAPSRQQTEFQIMQLTPVFVVDVSEGAADFILACLSKDPEVSNKSD